MEKTNLKRTNKEKRKRKKIEYLKKQHLKRLALFPVEQPIYDIFFDFKKG